MGLLAGCSVRLKVGRHQLSQHRTIAPVQIMTGVGGMTGSILQVCHSDYDVVRHVTILQTGFAIELFPSACSSLINLLVTP